MKNISLNISQTQDYSQAQAYISLLCGQENAEVTFQTFDDDSDRKDKGLAQLWHDTLANSWDRITKLNNEGAGVYVTVQVPDGKGNRSNDTIQAVRCVPLDFDGKLPTDFHLKPTIVDESSPGKGHAYWVLKEPIVMTREQYKTIVNRLIAHYGSEAGADKQCSDLARVLRLPGTYNMKPAYSVAGESPLVKLTHTSALTYALDEIMAGVPELETAKPKPNTKAVAQQQTIAVPPNTNFTETLDAFANKLRKAPEGERNSTLNTLKYTLAGAFPDNLETIDEVLRDAALEIGLSEAEIDATLASANKGTERPITLKSNGGNRSKSNLMREALDNYFDGKLQWDEMKNKLRFRGEHCSIERLHDICERELDLDLPFDSFKRIASVKAQENPYHAARAYLQNLTAASNPEPILSALYQAMGVFNPLHRLYIRRWLVSAVARALNPGCKADNALVLQGKQGIGKTTFFAALFGEFFQTVGEHKSEVDQLLSMTRSWCCEYGEIENAFSKKAVAAIKSFMSITSDTFRRPYASEPEEYNRHFVICGTTNQSEFLSDSTGNRRFWVVPVDDAIDRTAVAEMRDDVWSAVLALYLSDEQWWLTEVEAVKAAEDTTQYEQENPWTDAISSYLHQHNPCTLRDIMEHGLGFDLSRCNDKKAQGDITSILKKLGCTKKEARHNGVKGRYWYRPTLDNTNSNDVKVTVENIPQEEYF